MNVLLWTDDTQCVEALPSVSGCSFIPPIVTSVADAVWSKNERCPVRMQSPIASDKNTAVSGVLGHLFRKKPIKTRVLHLM